LDTVTISPDFKNISLHSVTKIETELLKAGENIYYFKDAGTIFTEQYTIKK